MLRNSQPQDIPSILFGAGDWANAPAFACDLALSLTIGGAVAGITTFALPEVGEDVG
jgi:hypothetical protein